MKKVVYKNKNMSSYIYIFFFKWIKLKINKMLIDYTFMWTNIIITLQSIN